MNRFMFALCTITVFLCLGATARVHAQGSWSAGSYVVLHDAQDDSFVDTNPTGKQYAQHVYAGWVEGPTATPAVVSHTDIAGSHAYVQAYYKRTFTWSGSGSPPSILSLTLSSAINGTESSQGSGASHADIRPLDDGYKNSYNHTFGPYLLVINLPTGVTSVGVTYEFYCYSNSNSCDSSASGTWNLY